MKYLRINYETENMKKAVIFDDYKTTIKCMMLNGYAAKAFLPVTTLPSGKVIRADLMFEKAEYKEVVFQEIFAKKANINNQEFYDSYRVTIQQYEDDGYKLGTCIPYEYTPCGQVKVMTFVFYK